MTTAQKTELLRLLAQAESQSVSFAELFEPEDRAYAEYCNGKATGLRLALEALGVEVEAVPEATPEVEMAGFDYE